MAILNKDQTRKKPVIDLTGPNGNAYAVLGICSKIARKLGLDWNSIQEDAMSGDYEHLLEVCQQHMGNYIDFER